MSQFLRVGAVFLVGALVGPLLIAVVIAAVPSRREKPFIFEKDMEIAKLVRAYRAKLPARHVFLVALPTPDGRECGYNPEAVFPGGNMKSNEELVSDRWTDYDGYYALHRWRGEAQDEGYIAGITEKMTKDLSRFEAKFLRLCIESTIASEICSRKVSAYSELVDRFAKDTKQRSVTRGNEDRIVCSYVDGVAVRRGMKLSPPFNQEYADGQFRNTPWLFR